MAIWFFTILAARNDPAEMFYLKADALQRHTIGPSMSLKTI